MMMYEFHPEAESVLDTPSTTITGEELVSRLEGKY